MLRFLWKGLAYAAYIALSCVNIHIKPGAGLFYAFVDVMNIFKKKPAKPAKVYPLVAANTVIAVIFRRGGVYGDQYIQYYKQ